MLFSVLTRVLYCGRVTMSIYPQIPFRRTMAWMGNGGCFLPGAALLSLSDLYLVGSEWLADHTKQTEQPLMWGPRLFPAAADSVLPARPSPAGGFRAARSLKFRAVKGTVMGSLVCGCS